MILAWAAGPYLTRFSAKYLAVAVVTAAGAHGATSDLARQTRMQELLHWTELELRAAHQEDQGFLFLFTDRDPGRIDPLDLASQAIWIEPFTRTTHALLAGVERPIG